MYKKVILISIDGVRADAVLACGNPYVEEMMKMGSYTLRERTVYPSSTMPCHMSMFYSVPPEKHGTTVLYEAPEKPMIGLLEQIQKYKLSRTMFYSWEPLRELSRPICLNGCVYIDGYSVENVDNTITDRLLALYNEPESDFIFVSLGLPDSKGHKKGWMSEEYLAALSNAFDNVKRIIDALGNEFSIIVTTDHGGHDTCHGTLLDEDMIIPAFFIGEDFQPSVDLGEISILDIAPTIVDVMGLQPAEEWEGRSLVNRK